MILFLKKVFLRKPRKILCVFRIIKDFKEKKDSAAKYWFMIPVQESSSAEEARELETYSFKNG